MNAPRALVGSIRGMARPARPQSEKKAVIEAADIVRSESALFTIESIAKEISQRVLHELRADLDRNIEDELSNAIAEIRSLLVVSPFALLATSAEIDTHRDFLQLRILALRDNGGKFLSSHEQEIERNKIEVELARRLAGRYARHLRG
jgi:hypothetical protein